MTRLILIRHGLTDYSLLRYCGFRDAPLNEAGAEQCRRLRFRLSGMRIDKVYSSDLRRAFQSARIIFKMRAIEKASDFREMNFGILEGMKYDEALEKHPKLFKDLIEEPRKVRIPKGENLDDLYKRVKKGLVMIISQNRNKAVALVAHCGPIRVILCDALNYTLEKFYSLEQDTCALNIIDYPKGSSPMVVKINDTAHLCGEKRAKS